MATLMLTHPVCLEHDTGEFHPECPDRLRTVLRALETQEFMHLLREEAPLGTKEQILRAHCPHHVEQVFDAVPTEPGDHNYLDSDTVLSPKTGEAALRAIGAVTSAVDAVAAKQVRNAFCAVRPPGHHAERDAAMGFCFFNNAAVAALHARDQHGYQRVAIIDFDAHHGNGTQHILWDEPGILYASTHEEHAYPNTGLAEEVGGKGKMVNVPLPPGAKSEQFRELFENVLMPKLREFAPDFIIISAGFDAHASDPLAHLRLKTVDYRWMTEQLLNLASETAGNRVVSILEGGYDLNALSASVKEHVRVLMGL